MAALAPCPVALATFTWSEVELSDCIAFQLKVLSSPLRRFFFPPKQSCRNGFERFTSFPCRFSDYQEMASVQAGRWRYTEKVQIWRILKLDDKAGGDREGTVVIECFLNRWFMLSYVVRRWQDVPDLGDHPVSACSLWWSRTCSWKKLS